MRPSSTDSALRNVTLKIEDAMMELAITHVVLLEGTPIHPVVAEMRFASDCGGRMRAILCNAFEGIRALSLGEAGEPHPLADEVLIDVHAASVSYMDYLMI